MGKRIVIVDDSPTMRAVVAAYLTAGGYDVVACNNGADCLARITVDQPDLVLTDVNMPGMNGFELCRTIKDSTATSHIPVVLLTRLDEASDILSGLAAGAHDFIVKGKGQDQLVRRLQTVFQELDSSASAKKTAVATIGNPRGLANRVDMFKTLFEAIDREVSVDTVALLMTPTDTEHEVVMISRRELPIPVFEAVQGHVRETFELVAQRTLPPRVTSEPIVLGVGEPIGASPPQAVVKVPLLDGHHFLGVFGVFRGEATAQFHENIRFFFEIGVEAARTLRRVWAPQ